MSVEQPVSVSPIASLLALPPIRWTVALDRWAAGQINIYGALRRCRFVHWRNAATELTITLVFTLLPIWLPLIAFPMFGNIKLTSSQVFSEQIKNGELYIISAALMAPIYYFTFPQTQNSNLLGIRPFPSQQFLILIFIGTVLVASLAIVATKVQAASTNIPSFMIQNSERLFVFCCAIFLISLAVKNSLPDRAEQSLDQVSRDEEANYPPPQPQSTALKPEPDPDAVVEAIIQEHAVKEDHDVAS